MKDEVIINFCPTGMVPMKKDTPHVPISANEIIEQVHQAYEIGITIAHLHARQDDGVPTYKAEVFRTIFEGVRKHCPDLIICGSSSGRNVSEFEKRSEVIELSPDMCSLTLSSLNFMKSASLNAPDMIVRLFDKMIEYGVNPELECFDLGMINFGKYLLKKRNIDSPCYWNLIFGNISGFQANMQQMGLALNEIPKSDYVSFGGLGSYQLKVNSIAIANGLGVRVGLEDNIWFDDNRTKQATNLELVERVHALLEIHEKKVAKSSSLNLYNKKSKIEA